MDGLPPGDPGFKQTGYGKIELLNTPAHGVGGAKFHNADLTAAILQYADLFRVDFINTTLTGARFRRARCSLTTFAGVDLSSASELDSVIHGGPSNIDVATFLRSFHGIPREFLIGAGVPETFIDHSRAFLSKKSKYHSCFISYSSEDQVFAERLNSDLRSKNLRCWFAPEDLKIGDRFQECIEESIRQNDKVMIVLSENSVRSPSVEREVHAAREREDEEKRTVLFPIRIDEAVMKAPQPWAVLPTVEQIEKGTDRLAATRLTISFM